MEFAKVLQHRRAIRHFNADPISVNTLHSIVAAAQQAPSWGDSQPWRVTIATGDTLVRIKAAHQKRAQAGVTGNAELAPTNPVWPAASRHNTQEWSTGIHHFLGAQADHLDASQATLFNAPVLVYLTIPQGSPVWSVYDLGAFGQTLMLAAADYGVDSMPAYELVKYPDIVRQFTELPADQLLVMGIALGHRQADRLNDYPAGRTDTHQILTIKD
ncbi:nitroreductase [Levilactobacillus acidifarinae]|uniref:Nitroreductase domain-containing protein n=1 Tax=Levilactobacillus acidifarinae DSM 19394 = JCM 15949 TaxID=1423715 RepID=A0A0R1LJZ2_9LACO|nr:nitroreductase [Levilactobacillus acidifarinae]KRK96173.1 hypothetical protein FD25_GL002639 [Levilactobacillus acidifarinae DSM 19394]GEO69535.1 nitrobenzoate reductase [Levilactobacillus acidifarinae]